MNNMTLLDRLDLIIYDGVDTDDLKHDDLCVVVDSTCNDSRRHKYHSVLVHDLASGQNVWCFAGYFTVILKNEVSHHE